MATYAIGDIHGWNSALQALFDEVGFTRNDRIIFLGDYIDRGPDTKGVIDFLIRKSKELPVVFLRGNHEVMMLDARDSEDARNNWLRVGGREAVESYPKRHFNNIPDSHWNFLEQTLPYFESKKNIFVHAGLDPLTPLENQTDWDLYWNRFENNGPHISEKTWVCGHTSQRNGSPLSFGHSICIDTYIYGGGWLTCLNLDTFHYTQASQRGEIRKNVIEEFRS